MKVETDAVLMEPWTFRLVHRLRTVVEDKHLAFGVTLRG